MGIDVNDVKILINGGFQYLIKTCHQWAKDHPLVSGVLLFFYLLYIFLPSIFSMAFYTFPLVICAAILLGKSRLSLEKRPQNDIKNISKKDENKAKAIDENVTTNDHRRRPYLTSQMSRRTFGKDKSKAEGISKQLHENKDGFPSPLLTGDDPIIHKILEEEILPMKINKDNSSFNSLNPILEKTQSSITSASRSDSDSDEENDGAQKGGNKLVEWTEDDQRNLMDLGSSEVERNQRLESLIAKRRAKKLLSMQPRRNHREYLGSHSSFDDHMYQVGVIARAFDDGEHSNRSGSNPLMKLHSENPFDIPYDPHEEKPVLTGGGFEEEFFADAVQKDMPTLCRHESFGGTNSLGEHPLAKSLPSFFLKKPGFTRFRNELDVEESTKEIPKVNREGNDPTKHGQESPREVQHNQAHSVCLDSPTIIPPEEGKPHKFESETSVQNIQPTRSSSVSSTEGKKEEELVTKETGEETLQCMSNKFQLSEDHISENKEQDESDDSSSSSSSSSIEIRVNATKNEAFRNSVKKVLTCLVLPRSTGLLGKEKLGESSSSDPIQDSSPTVFLPTKMEERSLYTTRPHHSQTFSIASDMQVEVSETGSPTSGPPDPNTPTDRESLVYDGDVDKDANSGDEDLWGASPHPVRLGDLGAKFKLPDIIEESSNRGSEPGIAHNVDDPRTLSRAPREDTEQAQGRATFSLSPRSILPEDNRQEVVDQKSTNGDIIEPRSSSSSSSSSLTSSSRSKGLASQMQGKSEHLAEYLASLPPSETSSNTLEDPGPSHVRDPSAEVISVQDHESNAIFEMEEDKEDSKESKQLEGSRENNEQTTTAGQSKAPTEACFALEKHDKDNLVKKPKDQDQDTLFIEQNENPRGLEEESKDAVELDISSRKPRSFENEMISGSLSTTSKEETSDQSKSNEEPSDKPEEDMVTMSGNRIQDEVTIVSPHGSIIHEEFTSPKEPTAKADKDAHEVNKLSVDEASKGGKENRQERKDEPQQARVEEANMKLPSPTRAVSSRQIHNPKGKQDRWSDRHDTSFD